MRGRTLWFLVGAGAGVYTSVKARRLAYRLTPAGLADQAAALGLGMRAFGDEVRTGMAEREAQIAEELGLPLEETTRRAIAAAPRTAAGAGVPAGERAAGGAPTGEIEQRGNT